MLGTVLLLILLGVPFGLGYLFGSIPFGLILTRLSGAGDIRNIGSGNIGATNVLRTGRKGLAAATLLLDMGKGALAVLLISQYGWPIIMTISHPLSGALAQPGMSIDLVGGAFGEPKLIAALAALIGHCYPVWLRFKGGKGFATAAGVCLALAWPVMLVGALVWAVVLATSRISSVSSLSAILAAPIAAWAFGKYEVVPVLVVMAAIVIWKHRANIARLRAGTEPRIGAKA